MKPIIGTWKLIRATSNAADGSEMPPPYGGEHGMGLLTLGADGRMIAVLCDGRTQLPVDSPREYNSYCGAYQYDGDQLVTLVDATSNAEWLGTEQTRTVRFEGETLVLRPPLRAYQEQPEQRTLYWQKID